MAKPRFIKSVWVGKLNESGFVVYDPGIQNLNLYKKVYDKYGNVDLNKTIVEVLNARPGEGTIKITLWVYESKERKQFDKLLVKEELRENLNTIKEFDRHKIANAYLKWKYAVAGVKNKYEYDEQQEYIRCALEEIKSDDEDWYGRLRLINMGEDPN